MILIPTLMGALLAASVAQEERLKDYEYDESYAQAVKGAEAAEALLLKDAEAALKRIEEVLASLPPRVEVVLVVIYTKGINKGAEKERHEFFPWKVAGRCAMAAGLPEKAVGYFSKSPTSAALLEEAKQALKRPSVEPLLAAHDFVAARDLARGDAPLLQRVREACVAWQRENARKLGDPKQCLDACARVPAEWEEEELRYVRLLAAKAPLRDLALAAAKLDPIFHGVCRRAQETELDTIEKLVEEAVQATRAARPAVLERIASREKEFASLAAAKPYADLARRLGDLKERLPVDDDVLDRARVAPTLASIPAVAGELERLWRSEKRDRLSAPDRSELALQLATWRCFALFLEGRHVDDVAREPLVAEAFRAAPALPTGANPKLAAVRQRIGP